MTETSNKWVDFYKKRVNSDYQKYFNERYKPMIEFIHSFSPDAIIEAGCGIGSISKALDKHIPFGGFDINPEMVKLANLNNDSSSFFVGDILKMYSNDSDLVITHGVLEHFQDHEIEQIASQYRNSIHYVPLDKYHTPSFGDERLLPKDYWLNLLKPAYYFTMNHEHDLVFKL